MYMEGRLGMDGKENRHRGGEKEIGRNWATKTLNYHMKNDTYGPLIIGWVVNLYPGFQQ